MKIALGIGINYYGYTGGGTIPANVMRNQDGSPMLNQDGSYMIYQE
jgi:hypothetical protein